MATRRYAEDTTVNTDRSRAEIERTLRRYGASAFGYGWDQRGATVMFEMANRQMRFHVPLPDKDADEFRKIRTNKYGWDWATPERAYAKWEQACRQSWRALALVIKAKLEAVEAGITTVEQEFLAHIVLPTGATVGEWLQPQIASTYARNEMPALLPGPNHG